MPALPDQEYRSGRNDMKRILLPLEETDRSLKALQYVIENYTPDQAEVVLLMVDESIRYGVKSENEAAVLKELDEKLELIKASLEGYKVITKSSVGKAGVAIVRAARDTTSDMIVMTKSSKDDMLSCVGTTADYVLTNAPCDVLIISEAKKNAYTGLIYKTASSVVNLRGILNRKHSECLLPSVNIDCIYHFDVTVGRVRFIHTAYNPETRKWDAEPLPGQTFARDIVAGESVDILVKENSVDGKSDRIRIVNRDMKKEAVFTYKITAVPKQG